MTPRLQDADRLIFAVGLEDTAIGSSLRGGGLPLDEYELTGHTEQWRRGSWLEWRLPGPARCVMGSRGTGSTRRLGSSTGRGQTRSSPILPERKDLKVILDLVHYGTPTWLQGSFADPDFPEAISDYAKAVAERYRGYIAALHAAERAVGHGVVLRPQGYMAALLEGTTAGRP